MRRTIKKGLLLASLVLACQIGFGQGMKDIRINEVLVRNVNNYQDAYGQNIGWIELHNTGYSNVDVGGAILTVDPDNPDLTYRIPKNDKMTLIPPQGFLIFFAEGTSSKGTFHTNFTLDKTGYIALFDQGGSKGAPASEIRYNLDQQQEDISIGYYTDENDNVVFGVLPATTPLGPNDTEERMPKHEKFRMTDPYGFKLALTAMAVVFSALLVLYLIFRTVGKYNIWLAKKKERRAKGIPAKAKEAITPGEEQVNAEVIAAIALALQQWEEYVHDVESMVLTINRVTKSYSPWSSKIYGLTQTPNKK